MQAEATDPVALSLTGVRVKPPSSPRRPGRTGPLSGISIGVEARLKGTRPRNSTSLRRQSSHRNVPAGLDVHLVLDNLSAHKAPEVQAWLAHPKRRRFHMPFTPTSSSSVNLVERWFKERTDKRLRRGTFNNVPALIEAIELWVAHWNDDPRPFVWHIPAADIITKVRRGRTALAQLNSPTDH